MGASSPGRRKAGTRARQLGAASAQYPVEVGRGEVRRQRAKGLDERPEGQSLHTDLDAAALQHAGARVPGSHRDLANEARLADPGLAPDQHDGRAALPGSGERGSKAVELLTPTNEDGARGPCGHKAFCAAAARCPGEE